MNFKSIALATTALVAFAAAPANAGQYMGKVSLGVGNAWEDVTYRNCCGSDYDLDYTSLSGGASVNIPYSDRVNIQLDILGHASLDDVGGEGNVTGSQYSGFAGGLHVNYKDPSMGALGVFAAVGRADVGANTTSYYNAAFFVGGLEGEYYLNAWTLSAQVGYADSEDVWGFVKNAGFVNVGANFYASNKLKLGAKVGYLNGETSNSNSPSDIDEWNWAFSVEYLFGKSVPVSTFVEYRGQTMDVYTNPSDTLDRHEVRAGVRFYFGAGDDLQKADREGASFETPDVMTWGRFYH